MGGKVMAKRADYSECESFSVAISTNKCEKNVFLRNFTVRSGS